MKVARVRKQIESEIHAQQNASLHTTLYCIYKTRTISPFELCNLPLTLTQQINRETSMQRKLTMPSAACTRLTQAGTGPVLMIDYMVRNTF